jgi:sucrose-6-phosphate hydrolase SacC (GH32 family)
VAVAHQGASGNLSAAVQEGNAPFWQCAHSLPVSISLHRGGGPRGEDSLIQEPIPELQYLRVPSSYRSYRNVRVDANGAGFLPGLTGDALEILATFSVDSNRTSAASFGLRLRQLPPHFSCDVAWTPRHARGGGSLSVGAYHGWPANVLPQPSPSVVELHIFLDRSVLEVYSGGAAVSQRCLLSRDAWRHVRTSGELPSKVATVDAFAIGGEAQLLSLDSWTMHSMYAPVSGGPTRP